MNLDAKGFKMPLCSERKMWMIRGKNARAGLVEKDAGRP